MGVVHGLGVIILSTTKQKYQTIRWKKTNDSVRKVLLKWTLTQAYVSFTIAKIPYLPLTQYLVG